jgi:peroxiredoxin
MASRRQRPLLDAGTRAPDFQLSRLEGGEASFAELAAGGPVLLAFFKVTCPVCQLTMPFLERLHASGALTICGISQNDAADTREFNGYFGSALHVAGCRGRRLPASNAYGISRFPVPVGRTA